MRSRSAMYLDIARLNAAREHSREQREEHGYSSYDADPWKGPDAYAKEVVGRLVAQPYRAVGTALEHGVDVLAAVGSQMGGVERAMAAARGVPLVDDIGRLVIWSEDGGFRALGDAVAQDKAYAGPSIRVLGLLVMKEMLNPRDIYRPTVDQIVEMAERFSSYLDQATETLDGQEPASGTLGETEMVRNLITCVLAACGDFGASRWLERVAELQGYSKEDMQRSLMAAGLHHLLSRPVTL